MSARSRQRHFKPGHVCCYIGPVHVPQAVYDAWRAVADAARPKPKTTKENP